jgi:hypothetical protein
MAITAQFEFDEAEHRRVLRETWSLHPMRWVVPVAGILVPATMIWLGTVRYWRQLSAADALLNALPWVLLGAFFLGLAPLVHRAGARKALDVDPSLNGIQTRTVDETGLHVRGAGFSPSLGWGELVRVSETPNFFLFFYDRQLAHYIPKRALDDQARDDLRNLIQAHAPEIGGSALAARSV